MEKDLLICNMSGVYERMYPVEPKINMTDISGTNCYCDDEAQKQIRKRLLEAALHPPIRLLDSGNYHYLSYIFMEMIEEPFSLILIDNHPDTQAPGFGDILSCGGWVRYGIEKLGLLKEVYLVGMSEAHKKEALPMEDGVRFIDAKDIMKEKLTKYPVYLSIDKDVLSVEYAATDWDQGDMTMDELSDLVSAIASSYTLLGVDICGEKKDEATSLDIEKNLMANTNIIRALSR